MANTKQELLESVDWIQRIISRLEKRISNVANDLSTIDELEGQIEREQRCLASLHRQLKNL
jgi:archaellum component FlaC